MKPEKLGTGRETTEGQLKLLRRARESRIGTHVDRQAGPGTSMMCSDCSRLHMYTSPFYCSKYMIGTYARAPTVSKNTPSKLRSSANTTA